MNFKKENQNIDDKINEKNNNKLFFHLLWNTFLASIASNFVWFALVFWVYLETKSITLTSFIWGLYLFIVLISWIFFGAFVDHYKKKIVNAVDKK
jgi:DHA3 family multidrug efflux protein-like MFS transporter